MIGPTHPQPERNEIRESELPKSSYVHTESLLTAEWKTVFQLASLASGIHERKD